MYVVNMCNTLYTYISIYSAYNWNIGEYMRTATIRANKKVNFIASSELIERITIVAKETNCSFSEFARKALEDRLATAELEKIDKELADACKKARSFNKTFSSEWAKYETGI